MLGARGAGVGVGVGVDVAGARGGRGGGGGRGGAGLRGAQRGRQLHGDVVVAAGGAAARAGGGVAAHHHAAPHHLQPAPYNVNNTIIPSIFIFGNRATVNGFSFLLLHSMTDKIKIYYVILQFC